MDFAGKTVTIIGAARSGGAAARLIHKLKGQVKISDQAPEESIPEDFRQWIKKERIPVEFGGHTPSFIQQNNLIVLSPGVKIDAPPVQWARAKGIPVWSEIELGYRFCPCPIVAVTGSNGKTTVSTLITKNLQAAGKRVHLCGNVGYPFCESVLEMTPQDYVVLEISSFQLETIVAFKPHVAVLLNLSENHLDRHKDMEEYFQAKKRIFLNQGPGDYAVVNARDPWTRKAVVDIKSQAAYFNTEEQLKKDSIKNPNYLAAAVAAGLVGVPAEVCRRVFYDFKGVEHRLERVRIIKGVEFINDSKATTAEAGRWALQNIDKPIVMICGGRDKHIDFTVLTDLVREKVKSMVVIGEARAKLKEAFGSVVTLEECGSLDEAVRHAQGLAKNGECVLLSPMCASFDMFKNFEERGKIFKEIVSNLE